MSDLFEVTYYWGINKCQHSERTLSFEQLAKELIAAVKGLEERAREGGFFSAMMRMFVEYYDIEPEIVVNIVYLSREGDEEDWETDLAITGPNIEEAFRKLVKRLKEERGIEEAEEEEFRWVFWQVN